MKKRLLFMLVALVGLTLAASDFSKTEKEEIRSTISLRNKAPLHSLQIDNVFGAVTVSGYDGDEIQIQALKTIKADTDRDLEKARKEVSLETRENEGRIELIVSGPFRRADGCISWNNLDYIVQYDFQIRVPRRCDLTVSTVNDGDIVIEQIQGRFKVNNVNGKIRMSGIDGAGKAHTVNGSVRVNFEKSPAEDCSFHTINGDIELSFAAMPSADFWCKTFNGSVYSDFDLTRLPAKAGEGRRRGETFVYKSHDFRGLRIGRGGNQIKMDSLNGDLLIANGTK